MRNFKRFLSLLLAGLMVFGMLAISTGAKEVEADYSDAAKHLAAIGILKGDENGNLMLDQNVTRYQAALFFVQAITGKTDPSVWNADKSAIFSDVPEYGTAIDYLAGLGLIIGRGDGTYGYHDNITYQDMLVLAVRTLGYETEDMSYPYGYILEAGKLGLTENIDSVNFKAPLKRGETAQLIWDMLGTEIAFVDPLTGDIIYPGKEDESAYGIIVGPGKIERETYLEKAGFASGKMVVTVTAFTEGKGDEIDTVTVNYGGESYTLAAADLGISKETPKIDYLGLPKTLYVDCKADEFFDKYDTDSEESDAKVVFVSTDALTFVENVADGGSIRVVKPASGAVQITLGGVKFAYDKYDVKVYTFGDGGWSEGGKDTFEENFLYDAKEGYIGKNSNGAVRYIIRESEGEKSLHIYYTPYQFGQYFERTLRDATTSKDAKFVTLASYEGTAVENKDGEVSNFVEYLLGTTTKVTSATKSVSARNGEKAKTAILRGEEVKSGEFMYYHYNALDNIITVAKTHGGFKTGALTGTSAAKQTVKIGGTEYGFGFKGAYEADFADYAANESIIKDAIASYESGMDNVKFVVVDSNIVYITSYRGESSEADYDFAVVSFDEELIAELLGVKVEKLDYTADFVLDKEGYAYAAVLDTASGKWQLCRVDELHKDYDASEDEYAISGDIGTLAKYVDIAGDAYSKYGDYVALKDVAFGGRVFAVVEREGDIISLGTTEGAIDSAVIAEGLIFSDNSAKTNHIKAESDENISASRVTLDSDTVIVIIDGEGNVGIRRGVQKSKFTVEGEARFYAASSDLIVAYIESPTFAGGFSDASDWGDSRAAASEETYYIALPDAELVFEANDGDAEFKYTVTVTNLLDLRTFKTVESHSFGTDRAISLDLAKALYADEEGILSESALTYEEAFAAAQALAGEADDISYIEIAPENLTFTDADTVIVAGGALALPNALASVDATVVTIDKTGLDREDYDFDRLALNVEYSEDGYDASEVEIAEGVYGYEYVIAGDTVEEINEPAEGIFDQYIIDSVGKEILVPEADADDYEGAAKITVSLKILAHYDEDTGVLTLKVAKILK